MRRRELFVLDPGVRSPDVAAFNHIAALSPIFASYHLPAIVGMESVRARQDVADIAGVIVLGSSSSVTDGFPWQLELRHWLETVTPQQIPILGICFGHQLLAHMFGGRVDFIVPHGKRRKLRDVQVNAVQRLGLKPQRDQLVVSHEEHVSICPPDMHVIATSDEIAIEGLEHRNLPIYSFQSHIEATAIFCQQCNISLGESGRVPNFGTTLLQAFLNRLK